MKKGKPDLDKATRDAKKKPVASVPSVFLPDERGKSPREKLIEKLRDTSVLVPHVAYGYPIIDFGKVVSIVAKAIIEDIEADSLVDDDWKKAHIILSPTLYAELKKRWKVTE